MTRKPHLAIGHIYRCSGRSVVITDLKEGWVKTEPDPQPDGLYVYSWTMEDRFLNDYERVK